MLLAFNFRIYGKEMCSFVAQLFPRKSRAIVIARSSMFWSSCKTFNIAHYSKSIKDINTRL